jgi:hypothetical protein
MDHELSPEAKDYILCARNKLAKADSRREELSNEQKASLARAKKPLAILEEESDFKAPKAVRIRKKIDRLLADLPIDRADNCQVDDY